MKILNYELKPTLLLVIVFNIITTTTQNDVNHLQITTNHSNDFHKITRRSPLEIGYIVGVTSPDSVHHHIIHHHIVVPTVHHAKAHVIIHHEEVPTLHPVIIHHDVLPTSHHEVVVVAGSSKTKIIPSVKTDTHVLTHGVIIHDVKPHVLHETHVISHDSKSSRQTVLHDVVLIPIGHGHTVTLKHHVVDDVNPLRAHPGGYGVGVDFSGHGAGHGFYVNQNNNLF